MLERKKGHIHKFHNGLQERNEKREDERSKNKTKYTHKIIVAKNVRRERERGRERHKNADTHLKIDRWGVEKLVLFTVTGICELVPNHSSFFNLSPKTKYK